MNLRKFKNIVKVATHCYYCEREFNNPLAHKNAGKKTIDHIIPLCWRGANSKENVVIACEWCNNEKHDRTLEDFITHIENLKLTLAQSVQRHINLQLIQKNIKKLLAHES